MLSKGDCVSTMPEAYHLATEGAASSSSCSGRPHTSSLDHTQNIPRSWLQSYSSSSRQGLQAQCCDLNDTEQRTIRLHREPQHATARHTEDGALLIQSTAIDQHYRPYEMQTVLVYFVVIDMTAAERDTVSDGVPRMVMTHLQT